MPEMLNFHHIGVAVFSIEKTADAYVNMGYTKHNTMYDPEQNVNVCLLTGDSLPMLELLEPYNEQSPICKILEKSGVSAYHQCYEVTDIDVAVSELRKQHFMPITKKKYSNVFNSNVCFLINNNVGLIELVQKL